MEDRPIASEEYERDAHELFPHQSMTPEEYAGRYAHGIYCSSFDSYAYRNKQLEAWIYAMHDILRSGRLREIQLMYHSPEELDRLETEM